MMANFKVIATGFISLKYPLNQKARRHVFASGLSVILSQFQRAKPTGLGSTPGAPLPDPYEAPPGP
jgi:hypothetical protein